VVKDLRETATEEKENKENVATTKVGDIENDRRIL